MSKSNKLTCGVGINDADYAVQKWENPLGTCRKSNRKLVWSCPYFTRWKCMIIRCYYEKRLLERPSYRECSVCEEWFLFSNFKSWMETQVWEGLQLDKDILCEGNKVYSPETCVFISSEVNNFILDRLRHRGKYPIGVHLTKSGTFGVYCNNNGAQIYLGCYSTPELAHEVWRKYKYNLACKLANEQPDERVAESLRKRYL